MKAHMTLWNYMNDLGFPGLIIVALFVFGLIRSNPTRGRKPYGELLPALCGLACYGFFQNLAFQTSVKFGLDTDYAAAYRMCRATLLLGFGCALSLLAIVWRLLQRDKPDPAPLESTDVK